MAAAEGAAPRRSGRGILLTLGFVGVVAYGGQFLVRRYVDQQIQHAVGQPLPEFALRDQGGTVWTAAALRGRPAVLHFFRSYCHSCEAEAPALRALEQTLDPQRVTLLHVMTDVVLAVEPAVTQATLARKGFARPVLLADAAFMDAFHSVRWSQVTPITYVVDAAGVVRQGLRGPQTVASVQAALAAVQ